MCRLFGAGQVVYCTVGLFRAFSLLLELEIMLMRGIQNSEVAGYQTNTFSEGGPGFRLEIQALKMSAHVPSARQFIKQNSVFF